VENQSIPSAAQEGAPAVRVVRLDDLVPDAANVRRRDDRAKKSLDASLRQFGPGRSIVLDGKDVIRAGNGTVEAAQRVGGIDEVLIIEPKPNQLVAVRRSDWTATEATGYAIADNRLGELAEWDEAGLANQLESLEAEEFDLDSLGFTEAELAEYLSDDEEEADSGEEETVPPEKWMVVIECNTEQAQVALLERFKSEGLACKAFIA